MNLTPSERAAMVKDLEMLEDQYASRADTELFTCGRTRKYDHFYSVSKNYRALASALKEGLKFNEVA
jgi:hypothetical protein